MVRRLLGILVVLGVAMTTACTGGERDAADDGAAPGSSTVPSAEHGARDEIELASDVYVAGYPMVVSMRTLQRTPQLPPLPTQYPNSTLTVHMIFEYQR